MKPLLVVLSLLSLAGCAATSETEVHRGHKGVHISCSGFTSSWGRCYASAAVACGGDGYHVLAKSSQHGEDEDTGFFGFNPAGLTTRKLLVMCN
ncbi:hypothetical protein [Pseudomonas typographi]|uniref:Lipoprotein n=1 Tax=Pseudomonas typographi TaxID=2715964 RepID=A0ABR7Z4F8_9PSED|nr:hypothetical protein [Pseudomonas typographi]MBD1588248.1 hypothetical protein [Pseudomonas typographi]MBD1600219.1 hypothetical protein [Pseudomonas typographi]